MLNVGPLGPPFVPYEGRKASKSGRSRNEGIPEGRGGFNREINTRSPAPEIRCFKLLDVETELTKCCPEVDFPQPFVESLLLKLFNHMWVMRCKPWSNLTDDGTRRSA